MNRTNVFIKMSDEILEKCYHEFISMELKKLDENAFLFDMLNQYIQEIGEKAAKPIMVSDLLHEIAKRWCMIYKSVF